MNSLMYYENYVYIYLLTIVLLCISGASQSKWFPSLWSLFLKSRLMIKTVCIILLNAVYQISAQKTWVMSVQSYSWRGFISVTSCVHIYGDLNTFHVRYISGSCNHCNIGREKPILRFW